MAQLSEKANYEKKNFYRLNNKTLKFAESKKMPISEAKVKDMLRNQHIFRKKMDDECGTYSDLINNAQNANGILTYLEQAAYGDMKDLIEDVGITKNEIPYHNLNAVFEPEKNEFHESDDNFDAFQHAMFTPLDMTDHEDNFVGWNELAGDAPLANTNWVHHLDEEALELFGGLPEEYIPDNQPLLLTGPTNQSLEEDLIARRAAQAEWYDPEDASDEEEYGDEEEGDGEEADYGEEEEQGETEPEPEGESEIAIYEEKMRAKALKETDMATSTIIPHIPLADRFFHD